MKTKIGIALCIFLATAFSNTRSEIPGAESPRNGKYTIYAYGAAHNPPIYLGYFILTDGSYKAYLPGDKVRGEGKFSYNKGTHEVTWDSGPYAGVYGGTFTIESGGKRHQLRLKSSTVAGNDG